MNPTTTDSQNDKIVSTATTAQAKAAKKADAAAHKAHQAKSQPPLAHHVSLTKRRPKSRTKPALARHGTKTAKIIALLQRPDGATLPQLQKATGWLPHSVRGFLSGTLRKKMSLTVTSTKDADGEHRYCLQS